MLSNVFEDETIERFEKLCAGRQLCIDGSDILWCLYRNYPDDFVDDILEMSDKEITDILESILATMDEEPLLREIECTLEEIMLKKQKDINNDE